MGWCNHNGASLYIGGFNGDSRDDMLCHDTRGYICGSRTPILLDNLLVPDGKEPRITANVRNASSV